MEHFITCTLANYSVCKHTFTHVNFVRFMCDHILAIIYVCILIPLTIIIVTKYPGKTGLRSPNIFKQFNIIGKYVIKKHNIHTPRTNPPNIFQTGCVLIIAFRINPLGVTRIAPKIIEYCY